MPKPTTRKSSKAVATRRPAFMLHRQHKDGAEYVYLGNLRVLITKHEDGWLAQGLEVDYSIDGATADEVKRRFEEGLSRTVEAHLRIYKHARQVMTIAPQSIWDKFFAAVPPDLQHSSGLITVRVVPSSKHRVIPFDRIIYAQVAAA